MEASKTLIWIMILGAATIASCDETNPQILVDDRTPTERLMTNQWEYQYIIIDSDTVVVLQSDTISTDTIHYFNRRDGEPITATERNSDVRRTSLLYTKDFSYQLVTDVGFFVLGTRKNYQPNSGYWSIESEGDSAILVHNKLMSYEKKYYIMTLTSDTLVRRLIGPRTIYYCSEGCQQTIKFTAHTWIEVFARKE